MSILHPNIELYNNRSARRSWLVGAQGAGAAPLGSSDNILVILIQFYIGRNTRIDIIYGVYCSILYLNISSYCSYFLIITIGLKDQDTYCNVGFRPFPSKGSMIFPFVVVVVVVVDRSVSCGGGGGDARGRTMMPLLVLHIVLCLSLPRERL